MSTAPALSPHRRLPDLDALRGLAVILMLGQHLIVWLVRPLAPGETAAFISTQAISGAGGLAAPIFVVLAGLGASLRQCHAPSRPHVDGVLGKRGAILLGLGYALSFATPHWFSWRSWYVLHLLGLATLFSAGMTLVPKHLHKWSFAGFVVLCGVITPWLQNSWDVATVLNNVDMAGMSQGQPPLGWLANLSTAVRIALVAGHFSLLPWFLPYGLGRLLGVQHDIRTRSLLFSSLAIGLVGALGLLFGLSIPLPAGTWPARWCAPNAPFFPASVAMVLALSGLALLLLTALRHWPQSITRGPGTLLVPLGRVSLTILVIHIVLFREGGRAIGMWQNFAPWLAGLTWVLTVAICTGLARAWSRIDFRYSIEWWLRRFAG